MTRLQSLAAAVATLLAVQLGALGHGVTHAALVPSALFPLPDELRPDVGFWLRIYTEVSVDQGLIHDSRHLGVVYEAIRLPANASRRTRERLIERAKKRYRDALRTLASGKRTGLTSEQARVLALWPEGVGNSTLRSATRTIRFQLGQADKFRAGLIRAGAWRDYIEGVFRDMGLPVELASLPHVESSYTPFAHSRVGAAGLWQFTRSTGRRYMRVGHVVDERLDPLIATVAAARLLQHNFKVTGTWPLALTAYNHGASGMRRATRKTGTKDIATIVRTYKSRTFGFASRNFYVEFLAALEIDSNPEKYFGDLTLDQPAETEVALLPFYGSAKGVAAALGIDIQTLQASNPSLRPAVWSGSKRIPKGHEIRVLRALLAKPLAMLIAEVPESARFAAQTRDTYHKVRRGETLSVIAARYRTSISELARLNGLRSRNRIRAGQLLRLPEEAGARKSSPRAAGKPAPAQASTRRRPATSPLPANEIHTVRRGDTLENIAGRYGMSERQLVDWNGIRDPNLIARGQRLRLAPGGPKSVEHLHPELLSEFTPPPSARAEFSTAPWRPSEAMIQPPEPLENADTDLLADPSDYSVATDGTIEIQAAETLGHYAEWLDARASRLRSLNHMRYGTPLAVGERLRLDFALVDPQTFEARRVEHHREVQGQFFSRHEIVGTSSHRLRSGDSIWQLAQQTYEIPVWLIRQYNPDLDFNDLPAGANVTIPKIHPR